MNDKELLDEYGLSVVEKSQVAPTSDNVISSGWPEKDIDIGQSLREMQMQNYQGKALRKLRGQLAKLANTRFYRH